jgi:hypothetical protein
MTNCLVCGRLGTEATVVGVCLGCGAMLCAAHRREAASAGPAGMRWGCPHVVGAQERPETPSTAEHERLARVD